MKFQFFSCFILLSLLSFAQPQQDSIVQPTIQVIARVQEGKILVRWAPTDAVVWQRGNTYGYILERFTVYRDGKRLDAPEQKTIVSGILKPAPVASWEQISMANDNAAILAQAIYGEDFEIGTEEGELMAIVNKVQQLEQRYSFALFAADMNFEAAKLAGLAFEDSNIKKNEGYLYRVKSAIPIELAKVKEGVVYIEASKTAPLPEPIDLVGVFNDKEVLLTWEYELFKSIYATYYVERSEDGTNYKRLGDLPLVNLNNTESSPTKKMYYIDTLAQNNKTYHYRVLGVSPFGEEGKPSKPITGQGQKALTATPFITNHKIDGSTATIFWEFPKEKEIEVAEFQVGHATKENEVYKVIQKGLAPETRFVNLNPPHTTNYYKIIALGKDSTTTASFSDLVQFVDSIPPEKPIKLNGVIDSLGITTLTWESNSETDILGYRVFRANLKNEEYTQITVDPILDNQFKDTVQLKSLNNKVFYTIVAVDKRYNNSEYSEVLELKKPDIIPPSAPIFKKYNVSNNGVRLSWILSASDDVAKHQLYRKNKSNDSEWVLVFETNDTLSSYEDISVAAATKYTYKIQAKDERGLISADSPSITVETPSNTEDKVIKGLNAVVNREQNSITLSWRKLPEEIKELVIYKAKKEKTPATWRQLPAKLTEVIDKNISPSNIYIYQVRPVYANGSYGKLEVLEVNY